MQAVLQDLAGMSASLRQGRSVLNTEPGGEKYRFIGKSGMAVLGRSETCARDGNTFSLFLFSAVCRVS